jgi:hypothetical protein
MKPNIDASRLKELFDYDEESGELTWKIKPSHSVKRGDLCGTSNGKGYLVTKFRGRRIFIHRIAWAWVYGTWPVTGIDHINGDGLDNRICNLREATGSQNVCNQKISVRNTSGVKGVSWNKQRGMWKASLSLLGKEHHVGYFNSLSHAATAIEDARFNLHKEFARQS